MSMSSPTTSALAILLASIICLSFSARDTAAPSAAPNSSVPPLIQQVCYNSSRKTDSALCAKVLQSDRKVASARNLFNLSVAIMQSGKSYAKIIQMHVDDLVNRSRPDSAEKAALEQCKSSYDQIVTSFRSAITEAEDDRDFQSVTYDLLIGSTDYIQRCSDALASMKIADRIILEGNKVVPVYGLSAYEAINRLGVN